MRNDVMKINCLKNKIVLVLISLALFAGSSSMLFAAKAKKKDKKAESAFIGKWVFHSVMHMEPEGEVKFLTAEELLNYVPSTVDKNDEKAMEEIRNNQKFLVNSVLEISEDGNVYLLSAIPEGVSKKEIDEYVAKGEITLRNGMVVVDKPTTWEDRNGELWLQMGKENLAGGTKKPNWEKCEFVDGILTFSILRYQKAK